MPRTLANDICRCIGADCAERERCLRHLLRHNCGERTPVAPTLVEPGAVSCESIINAPYGTWVRWKGGLCPVSKGTTVRVRYDGGKSIGRDDPDTGIAGHFDWRHQNQDYYYNIIAFQVIESAVE